MQLAVRVKIHSQVTRDWGAMSSRSHVCTLTEQASEGRKGPVSQHSNLHHQHNGYETNQRVREDNPGKG